MTTMMELVWVLIMLILIGPLQLKQAHKPNFVFFFSSSDHSLFCHLSSDGKTGLLPLEKCHQKGWGLVRTWNGWRESEQMKKGQRERTKQTQTQVAQMTERILINGAKLCAFSSCDLRMELNDCADASLSWSLHVTSLHLTSVDFKKFPRQWGIAPAQHPWPQLSAHQSLLSHSHSSSAILSPF